MNAKAKALGMTNTRYVEPTGLSIHNVSTARDLTKLMLATKQYPLIGQLSTTTERMATFKDPNYTLPFSQYQPSGLQPEMEYPADQNRLYQPGRALPGDAYRDR
ncbi:D-alanyl-D-alanine endopeptidase precursor [Serratia fonticola]|uniref:D-alanyl-D-alanine endopeptidase n=1 Tax=Serratia fonticola TaxID=47917 RepID=A0A4U9VXN8_SERFO|nr:D-alanyl-D-alanine endopeptidase precursor [Serratia fonticola]